MNKKGQALVEFIIVFPIFLLIILAVFDIVKIEETKITLEGTIEDVILDESKELEDDINLEKNVGESSTTYVLSKNIDITSPILVNILESPYKVSVKRVINNE